MSRLKAVKRSVVTLAITTVVLSLHQASAQYTNDPFYEHTELLAFAHGTEMIGIRLAALTAIDDPDEKFVEEIEEGLEEDLLRFAGSLEAQDSALKELEAALEEVLQAVGDGDGAGLEAAVQRAQDLTRQAQSLLVPAELLESPSFVAALMATLLLADDGVAEGYEDAAEGDIWEYPVGWAALQRVRELWEGLSPAASETVQFEVEDMFQFLDGLYPSATPPEAFGGDPEEAEAPAHRIVQFLEEVTDADLYPGRDLGRLAKLTRNLVQGGCAAYAGGQERIGLERTVAANFYYREHLRRLMDLLAPELHEDATDLFSELLAADSELGAASAQCQELLGTLDEARSILGGQ